MQEVIILGIAAWWLSEGSMLVKYVKAFLKKDRLLPFDCPKCLGFWTGLFLTIDLDYNLMLGFNPVNAILVSFTAMVISKLYWK